MFTVDVVRASIDALYKISSKGRSENQMNLVYTYTKVREATRRSRLLMILSDQRGHTNIPVKRTLQIQNLSNEVSIRIGEEVPYVTYLERQTKKR